MAQELDLGSAPSSLGVPEQTKPSKPKKSYPSFSVRDEVADRFKKKFGDCDTGDEYTLTIKAKVSGTRSDEYGRSIEFQVLSVVGDTVEEEEEYEAPKKKKGMKPAEMLKQK